MMVIGRAWQKHYARDSMGKPTASTEAGLGFNFEKIREKIPALTLTGNPFKQSHLTLTPVNVPHHKKNPQI